MTSLDDRAVVAIAALLLSDAAAMAVPLIKRESLDRPQALGIPIALMVTVGWVRVLRNNAG